MKAAAALSILAFNILHAANALGARAITPGLGAPQRSTTPAPGPRRRCQARVLAQPGELPAAADQVAAISAGAGAMLEIFVKEMTERATEVRAHAREDRDALPMDNEGGADEPPAATAYH